MARFDVAELQRLALGLEAARWPLRGSPILPRLRLEVGAALDAAIDVDPDAARARLERPAQLVAVKTPDGRCHQAAGVEFVYAW